MPVSVAEGRCDPSGASAAAAKLTSGTLLGFYAYSLQGLWAFFVPRLKRIWYSPRKLAKMWAV